MATSALSATRGSPATPATEQQGRAVVLAAFPGMQALDLVGPMEVFTGAAEIVPGAYLVRVATPGRRAVRTSSGLVITPTSARPGADASPGACADADADTDPDTDTGAGTDANADVDTLLVCGGPGVEAAEHDERLMRWLQVTSGNARRVAAVCTGALLLARAGLLDGRRATTHWAYCRRLAERHPQVTVEPDAIFVRDGRV